MHRIGVTDRLQSRDTLPDIDTPETGEVAAIRELGPLLASDERFAALHDVMGIHTATSHEGFDVRLVEYFVHLKDQDPATGILLSLSMGRQVVGVWDLGLLVERVEGVESVGAGRLEVAVVPRFTEDEEPQTNRLTLAYTMEGAEASALRLRFGRRSKIVPKSGRRRDLFLQRIHQIHEVEIEREDVVHARLFECEAMMPTPGRRLLLQLSDADGEFRTFDLGFCVGSVAHVELHDEQSIVVQGRPVPGTKPDAGTSGVNAIVRGIGSSVLPERIAVARTTT
jgi:hypothetical protein